MVNEGNYGRTINKIVNWLQHHSQDKRIVVGISGHGASGKTTFAHKLLKQLGENGVTYINTDPYIIGSNLRKYTLLEYEYNNEKHQDKMTACHPAAHNHFALERDVRMIRDGLDFYSLGTSYSESTLIPSQKSITIVEGMTVAFTDPELYDLKIYFYTDGETEFMRRSIRDITERGMAINYLRRSHGERRIQYELFMHPYHENFDLVIKNSNDDYRIEKNNLLTRN